MAGKEHVISMEEFHSRYSVRRVTGETSSSATDEAETKSIQIQTTTLEARVQKIREAKENANNQSHLIPKIQKVIFFLRDEKNLKKYYEPRVVSLGRIHHRNPKYQLGEQYKLLLTYEFVNVTPQTRQGLVHEKTTIQRPVNFFPKHFITVCQLRISKVQVH